MDQTLFTEFNNLYDRIGHNLTRLLSDHGFEILTIVFVAWAIRKFGSQFLAKILETTARPDLYPTKSDRTKRLVTLENLASDLLRVGTYIIAGIMIVHELGVDTTPLIASAGALGLVVGIGAQGLVRDIASGISIILGNQYRIGDTVELFVSTSMTRMEGVVEDIGVRTTSIRSLDGDLHFIPNGNILTASNKTIGFSRVNIDLVVDKDTDIEKLRLIIDRVGSELAEHPDYQRRIKDAPKLKHISAIDTDGIHIKILGKTGSNDSRDVRSELYSRLLKAFKKAKITII